MIKVGLECKMYRGAAGAIASILVKNIKDVTLNLENEEADVTTRAAEGWHMFVATLKNGSVEFAMNYDPDDADLAAITAAWNNRTPIALFVSDGEGNGLDADFVITQYNISEPLTEAREVSVTARPTNIGGASGRAPNYISNGSGTKPSGSNLGGAIALSGTEAVGETLTCSITGVTPSAAQTGGQFAWYRNADLISGAVEATYTLAAADSGNVVTVKYTHPLYGGSLSDSTTGVIA